jgi:nucleotide-binding universal stress UspA family protein
MGNQHDVQVPIVTAAIVERPRVPGEVSRSPEPGGPAPASASATPQNGRRRIATVMLATDFSAASASATETAFDLAASLGATLLAVSVIDPGSLRLPGGRFHARVDQVREERERVAQHLVGQGRHAGVPVRFLVWEGDPGESVVEAATAEGADLIVLGSHGRGGVGRFLIGSVSDHVIRNAPCPVLVVRSNVSGAGTTVVDGQGQSE